MGRSSSCTGTGEILRLQAAMEPAAYELLKWHYARPRPHYLDMRGISEPDAHQEHAGVERRTKNQLIQDMCEAHGIPVEQLGQILEDFRNEGLVPERGPEWRLTV